MKVRHLEKLSERSSLSSSLKKSLANSLREVVRISQEMFTNSEASQATLVLNAKEKEARSARQLKRYGRTYRVGVHTQIREMKQNLTILKIKHAEYQRYKGLVDVIDRQVTLTPTASVKGSLKMGIGHKESSLKIALKAELMRENIPTEFRANSGDRLSISKDNNDSGTTHIRNTQSEPVKTTLSSETKNTPRNSYLGTKDKVVNAGASAHFKREVEIDKKILSQANPSWRTAPKEGATPFDPMGKANTQKPNQKESKGSSPDGHRPWVTENSEKMDALTDVINKKQAQSKQESRVERSQTPDHDPHTMRGQFNDREARQSHSHTTREAQQEKSSVEAKASRERTPPEYRAEPYPPKDDIASSSGNESIKDKVQERFKDATGAFKEKWDHFRGNTTDSPQEPPNPDANKPRSTMSSGFNKSSFEGRSQSDMNDTPNVREKNPKNEI